ncbi:biotin--[acetyl-CoA-carboxylase] ligase [Roseateles oligotrophus]|uniref:biotin--[biotin carboxyl-carrier protein] ligase n=1 Tax=Roseateles oligotrophus TaxID=1769250 RepID=A0ABT2YJX8_9BURK|nr:biotin--[acetyl-CoA-carboxylase] ligase [Roseateles oligotrophus]MCV2370372.1 biotin--[acetyl-CoA-carboxylase] ligase [Roseateles oligotrophus]
MTAIKHQNWNTESLYGVLQRLLPGISIEVLARCESTNSALLERVKSESRSGERQSYGRRAHDMQPCLLVAEHQTHGRGRLGRAWLSAPDNSLTFSLALNLSPSDWSGLSLAVGCAIADAIEPADKLNSPPRLTLKWPNDIWLDGRKLGGILIETVTAGEGRMVVIGVGLNISELSAGTDSEAQDSAALFNTGFAALNELLPNCTAPSALALIAPALVQCLLDFQQNGFAPWSAAYARRDLTLGRNVTAGNVEGISRGVSAQGELLLQTPQGLVAISGGEVSVRLAAATDSSACVRQGS